ncbi:MAG: methylcobamide--CoM methyltransferase [Chloroflexi bacterium]|nr:methylcobamide--CoM methyltransferase [Chloroflexota bacterium]
MLATVVGSYPKIPNRPRPARLRAAIARFERGEISAKELARAEDEVTVEVIGEQVEAGLDLISDGQVRWEDDQTHIARRLSGFSIDGLQRYLDTNTYFRQPEVEGAVAWQSPILVRDYQFAAGHSPRPVKAIITGPYTLAALSKDERYRSRRDLTLALAEALHREALALQEAGAPLIQVNDPLILGNSDDFPVLAEALKRMLDGVTVEKALYTWFGSIEGVYPQLLELPVDIIGIDFVSRAGNWEALRKAPFTKKLGFGIVDGRNTRLETADEIAQAVRRISDVCPPERLHVNPSCGLEYLPREEAFEKLKRLVEGVTLAQADLGG